MKPTQQQVVKPTQQQVVKPTQQQAVPQNKQDAGQMTGGRTRLRTEMGVAGNTIWGEERGSRGK